MQAERVVLNGFSGTRRWLYSNTLRILAIRPIYLTGVREKCSDQSPLHLMGPDRRFRLNLWRYQEV